MPTVQQILDRKKEVSGQVSAQTRTLALGLLAISWALLTAHDEPLHTMAIHISRWLTLPLAACAVLVIALDLLQYVAATRVAGKAIKEAEASESKTASYNDRSWSYKAVTLFYRAKFGSLMVGALLLLIIFVLLFRVRPSEAIARPNSPSSCCCHDIR
jgi:H+/Cl- antiporter ClcA